MITDIFLQKNIHYRQLFYHTEFRADDVDHRQYTAMIWERMKRDAIVRDTLCYNAYLKAAVRRRDQFTVEELLTEMREDGVRIDEATMATVINLFVRLDDTSMVLKSLDTLCQDGMAYNIVTLNVIMKHFIAINHRVGMDQIMKMMVDTGLKPRADTYHTLLFMFFKMEDVRKVEDLWARFKNTGLQLNMLSFKVRIRCNYGFWCSDGQTWARDCVSDCFVPAAVP